MFGFGKKAKNANDQAKKQGKVTKKVKQAQAKKSNDRHTRDK